MQGTLRRPAGGSVVDRDATHRRLGSAGETENRLGSQNRVTDRCTTTAVGPFGEREESHSAHMSGSFYCAGGALTGRSERGRSTDVVHQTCVVDKIHVAHEPIKSSKKKKGSLHRKKKGTFPSKLHTKTLARLPLSALRTDRKRG